MTHTPGPWGADTASLTVYNDANQELIADLSHAGSDDESEANARLIAAAPELLDALKNAQEAVRKLLNSQRPELIPELDPQGWGLLIAKAEGSHQLTQSRQEDGDGNCQVS